ncbi:protein lethal(2)essential for life-like [Paramormyrops kingsleyae]|nr:heat shock protein beta-7-like [Paramormyrops kingsleyae]
MSCGSHSVRARAGYSGSVTPRPHGKASSLRSGMATFSGSISRSSRYSSSSVRAESGSRPGLAFQPYLDAGCRRLFGNEGTEDHLNLSAFDHCGSSYSVSADVSQFEPGDVVVLAFNCCVVIHAEKVADDGSVSDTFTHRSQLPEDMDPLTVSSALTAEGILVVSVRKRSSQQEHDRDLPPPAYCAHSHV